MATECIATLQQHQHPPEAILNDLQHFLTPATINTCRSLVDKFKKKRDAKCQAVEKLKADIRDLRATQTSESKKESKDKSDKKAKTIAANEAISSIYILMFSEVVRSGLSLV